MQLCDVVHTERSAEMTWHAGDVQGASEGGGGKEGV